MYKKKWLSLALYNGELIRLSATNAPTKLNSINLCAPTGEVHAMRAADPIKAM